MSAEAIKSIFHAEVSVWKEVECSSSDELGMEITFLFLAVVNV